MDRLLLGSSPVGVSLAQRLADRQEPLLVLVDDEARAEALREEGLDARTVDITDSTAIRTVAGDVGSIVVAPEKSGRIYPVARTAREANTNAFIMACLGPDITDEDRLEISEHVDRLLDPAAEMSGYLLDRAGEPGIRTRKLQRILRDIDGTLAIVTHDNPDPDAIASGVGLREVAARAGTDAEVCYYGEISHQENRALVNLLEYDLKHLEDDEGIDEFGGVALVDHSRPGINDGLPEDTPVDIVIDHHPPRAPIEARFVDLRSDVGSTSTLVTGYLHQFGIEPHAELATGLLYGIQTDTRDFSRGVSMADFEAAARLVGQADSSALQRIESPSVTAETFETIARAIANRRTEREALTSCVGPIGDRDALAQAADKLLEMKDVSTTLVFGYTDEMVYVSARSRGTDHDLGEVLREAFEQIGSAGGHADMAGAQIPVGILVEETGDAGREDVIEELITERFFEALGIELDHAAALVYADFLGTDEGGE